MSFLNSTNRSQSEIKESEAMSRYLDRRVTEIEKTFTNLTSEFVGFARRTAKLRNNGDKIAGILREYADSQQYNSSSNDCIKEFCNTISVVEDLRNVELERITDHVIRPMIDYNACLKDVKVEIKKDMAARKKEIAAYKKLDKSQHGSTADGAKARANTHAAVFESTKQSERLVTTVSQFEKTKLEHIPSVLRAFIHIEMLWHMRALERYTEAYRTINEIDCQSDLNEFLDDLRNFRAQDHLMRSTSSLNLAGRRAQSMDNLRMTNASSHGDLSSGRHELRASVTFEDEQQQHQRANSFQQQQQHSPARYPSMGASVLREPTKAKPLVANGGGQPASVPNGRAASSGESDYSDDEDDDDDDEYTEDGTTSASARTASARGSGRPVPVKRSH